MARSLGRLVLIASFEQQRVTWKEIIKVRLAPGRAMGACVTDVRRPSVEVGDTVPRLYENRKASRAQSMNALTAFWP